MRNKTNKIIFIFLDGFGIGKLSQSNPFVSAPMPFIHSLLDGPLVSGLEIVSDTLVLKPIDATLGVEGVPQSATGQTALLTGVNAAVLLGQHLPAYPSERLIRVIQEHSILKQAVDACRRATFANPYTKLYFQRAARGKAVQSVTTHCVLAAKIPFRTTDDLLRGDAVYWDITRSYLSLRGEPDIPQVSPREAGTHLAGLSHSHDLVLYECFLPDLIGHDDSNESALEFLGMLDQFLEAVYSQRASPSTLVLSSDHGNIENMDCTDHTSNPVPLLAAGPAANSFLDVESITDVCGAVLKALGATVQNSGLERM
jgi:2,3-bisphosphoglycerate-independent phosphoglycerate mutase